VTNEPEVIAGYPKAILTLNGGEFPRLYNKVVRTGCMGGCWLLHRDVTFGLGG